ncbi:hypothetical protein PSTG_00029 [Puccinia striiformis f. sp. tritici PST-78]|uniref:Uncharacterized protein n=1 Tax=Puccinia striiformis f. sp. tritici PST-78 TaxID=1165861 RepID=A0A0L0W5C2_9BASI|nr:hypothetical protein PSTG_00029 [Puccinia striiformis f. sp. tritici PST-78]
MSVNNTQSTDHAPLPSVIPAGINPFTPISAAIIHQFTQPLSKTTITLLAIFLVFHSLIALFSLMMLILPYTRPTKRPQWFFKKSHIPAQLRGKGSLNTIAFICLQINPSRSLNYALRAQPLIPLGLMYMFEILAYWIMAHCFISLSYSSLDSAGRKAISLAKWEPPPAVVNVVFTCLPLCMVALITGTIIHGAVGYDVILVQERHTLKVLAQGASAWTQLQAPSQSEEQKNSLLSQLNQVEEELKNLTEQSGINLNLGIDYHRRSQTLYLLCMCVTCLFFIFSFWKLTHKLLLQAEESSYYSAQTRQFRHLQNASNSQEEITASSNNKKRTLRPDRQLLGFTVRACAAIIAMGINMICYLMNIFRTEDMMINPHWHGAATWIPTVSGSWASIPIAWQCWRLYLDLSLATV